MHDKQLQDKYNCAEPTDIVLKILNDNFDEITHIGTAILEFYGDSFNGFGENLKKAVRDDSELKVYRYYLRHGHKLEDLLNMNGLEFIFLKSCMDVDIEEEKEMWEP